jgi:mono/diheme cytochrome c family protein
MLIIGLAIILSACTGSNADPTSTSPPAQSEIQQEESQAAEETDQEPTDAETEDAEGESEAEPAIIDTVALFSNNCASCHKADRSGARGPSLLPGRLTKEASYYAETITNGSGPMPSFGGRLSVEEINALAEWILTPVE